LRNISPCSSRRSSAERARLPFGERSRSSLRLFRNRFAFFLSHPALRIELCAGRRSLSMAAPVRAPATPPRAPNLTDDFFCFAVPAGGPSTSGLARKGR
jgi:hypothetical protein